MEFHTPRSDLDAAPSKGSTVDSELELPLGSSGNLAEARPLLKNAEVWISACVTSSMGSTVDSELELPLGSSGNLAEACPGLELAHNPDLAPTK